MGSGRFDNEEFLRIRMSREHVPTFFACLCLGTLHAIRAGVVPAEVGIWSLGPPWAEELERWVPAGVRDVLYETDEIDGIQPLGGREALVSAVDEMIARLEAELRKIPDPRWRIWLAGHEDGA